MDFYDPNNTRCNKCLGEGESAGFPEKFQCPSCGLPWGRLDNGKNKGKWAVIGVRTFNDFNSGDPDMLALPVGS